jgi:5-methyltetrahydropteroyltriglutamate--homocysteine methyltransferase
MPPRHQEEMSMRRSTDRILTSHVGVLPRPESLQALADSGNGETPQFDSELRSSIKQIVKAQSELGIDVVNDGELGRTGGFSRYVADRMGGIEQRDLRPGEEQRHPDLRDRHEFPGFYSAGVKNATGFGTGGRRQRVWACSGPLSYTGQKQIAADVQRLLAATDGLDVEPFLTAVAPGTIEHWLWNEHYPNDESFLSAVADVMHEEYKAIADAGVIVQIDDPDLPDAWQIHTEMDLDAYRRFAKVRIDALNHALDGIPEELVRFHCCWGSYHGPHKNDIPLEAIVDLMLEVNAGCYSVEAGNPVHEHEWAVWENVKLPDGKLLMPGVVGHSSDLIEHPELVAQRLERFGRLVGRENIVAGTDCGLGHRVGHPEICWAKLRSLSEGAELAGRRLG